MACFTNEDHRLPSAYAGAYHEWHPNLHEDVRGDDREWNAAAAQVRLGFGLRANERYGAVETRVTCGDEDEVLNTGRARCVDQVAIAIAIYGVDRVELDWGDLPLLARDETFTRLRRDGGLESRMERVRARGALPEPDAAFWSGTEDL